MSIKKQAANAIQLSVDDNMRVVVTNDKDLRKASELEEPTKNEDLAAKIMHEAKVREEKTYKYEGQYISFNKRIDSGPLELFINLALGEVYGYFFDDIKLDPIRTEDHYCGSCSQVYHVKASYSSYSYMDEKVNKRAHETCELEFETKDPYSGWETFQHTVEVLNKNKPKLKKVIKYEE